MPKQKWVKVETRTKKETFSKYAETASFKKYTLKGSRIAVTGSQIHPDADLYTKSTCTKISGI